MIMNIAAPKFLCGSILNAAILGTVVLCSNIARAENAFDQFSRPGVVRLEPGNDQAKNQPVSLKGPAVVQFWASWCVGCRKNMEAVLEMVMGRPVNFVTVSLDENPEAARNYLQRSGAKAATLQAATLVDTKQQIAEALKISSVPTTLFIDRDGRITSRIVGHISAGDIRKIRDDYSAQAKLGLK